jgi:hypothetical protein
MSTLAKNIDQRRRNQEIEMKTLKEKVEKRQIEIVEVLGRYKKEREANAKLQIEYQKLELECNGLRGVKIKYGET